jgi:hypothetical protein
MKHAIEIISKHLDHTGIDTAKTQFKIPEICAISGKEITEGYELKKLLSGNFSDIDSLKFPSKYASADFAACIKPTLKTETGFTELRKYSFIASESSITLLRVENLLEWILKEKETPFVFCVGSLRASKAQKHTSFKAEVNYSNDIYTVSTEIGNVLVDMQIVKKILPIMQAWYTVTEATKHKATQLTYFSKDDILNECSSFMKIEQYGAEKYFKENAILAYYRQTLLFELLTKSLQKNV